MEIQPLISIYHSPDADDMLMFWALKQELVSAGNYCFQWGIEDTQTLNQRALSGQGDIIAVSAALLRGIRDRYEMMRVGASVGRNYGPALVALKPLQITELQDAKIAVPGEHTTAALILNKALHIHGIYRFQTITVPIVPFTGVYEALESKRVDAALLIHEGQFSYQEHGLHEVLNLGTWWHQATKLPIPLGVNAIRKKLPEYVKDELTDILRNSMEYGLNNLDQALPELMRWNTERGSSCNTEKALREYISRYVNADSLDLKDDVIEALYNLLT
ncbi:hypothetical protein JNK13_03595 [bacterium]|nr:hypothetical protein [bacterium]